MTSSARTFARRLGREATSAEDAVWQQLRGNRLGGMKWRRQVPIGCYTVDFLCFASKLIVELDGRGHATQAGYDIRRTVEIESQGFVVLRFSNESVRDRLGDVLHAILAAAKRDPSPGRRLPPSLDLSLRER